MLNIIVPGSKKTRFEANSGNKYFWPIHNLHYILLRYASQCVLKPFVQKYTRATDLLFKGRVLSLHLEWCCTGGGIICQIRLNQAMLCTLFMCVFRWWTVNHLSHSGHCLFSFWWTPMWWTFNSAEVLKLFPHPISEHVWPFPLSVCLFFMWLSNHFTIFPHTGQALALPCTICSCSSRWTLLL